MACLGLKRPLKSSTPKGLAHFSRLKSQQLAATEDDLPPFTHLPTCPRAFLFAIRPRRPCGGLASAVYGPRAHPLSPCSYVRRTPPSNIVRLRGICPLVPAHIPICSCLCIITYIYIYIYNIYLSIIYIYIYIYMYIHICIVFSLSLPQCSHPCLSRLHFRLAGACEYTHENSCVRKLSLC